MKGKNNDQYIYSMLYFLLFRLLCSLFNEDNKQKVIDELNKNVNIPIINEDTEEKIISAIYNVFEDVMGKVLKK